MDVLTAINKQFQEDRKKQLKIRFKVVKNRDIVKHLSIDELKAKSPKMTEYLQKISSGVKTARSRNYKPQSTCGQLYDPYDESLRYPLIIFVSSNRPQTWIAATTLVGAAMSPHISEQNMEILEWRAG